MRKIMIHSDGFGGTGTVILDDDGKILEQVTAIDLHVEAQRVNTAVVYMDMVQINSEAHVEEMIFNCPLCGWTSEHKCDTTLGTQGTQLLPLSVPIPPPLQIPNQVFPPAQVLWNPTLPLPICGETNANDTCRMLSGAGAHSIHVDTISGAVWADTFRQLTTGQIHQA